jgi:3'(2'), 5'-bisphosphate nucleotidase
MDEYSPEVKTAIQGAVEASILCQHVQKDLIGEVSFTKSDRSPVTVADYGAQAIICKLLKESFPEDPIIAEEDSVELKKPDHSGILAQVTRYVREHVPDASPTDVCEWIDLSSHSLAERFWALDPIDGTKGFLRGDQYAIALALVEKGEVRVGVLACPSLYVDIGRPEGKKGCIFLAVKGKGAFRMDMDGANKRTLSTPKIGNISEVLFTESVEPDHSDHRLHRHIAHTLGISRLPLRIDSQVKYGIVARGEAALYLRIPAPSEQGFKENIWDHAAGVLVAEEAGGSVTDAFGHPLDFASGLKLSRNYGIVVTNGIPHDPVLDALGFRKGNNSLNRDI